MTKATKFKFILILDGHLLRKPPDSSPLEALPPSFRRFPNPPLMVNGGGPLRTIQPLACGNPSRSESVALEELLSEARQRRRRDPHAVAPKRSR